MVKLAATVGMGNNLSSVSAPLLPSPLGFNPIRRCFCVVKSSLLIPARIQGRLFTPKVRASSATVVETKPVILSLFVCLFLFSEYEFLYSFFKFSVFVLIYCNLMSRYRGCSAFLFYL
ncbi:hypothetical protein CDL12_05514 [Handroanthus impetiginosus]|uniref:Uncharacterized protein n=1 Tax=Handroanthus impetiginosus TaxID=429701 RepID=A0A2G9HW97_9LAMI|nr:hypothetical protein CDL12_05514 [Handroanthus impetiginosus]